MGRKPSTDKTSTLTPLMFQILVALSAGERYGYAIMQEIDERTKGAFNIGAGSMYRSIKQLVDAELVAETNKKGSGHRQRRYYRLTPAGRRRAAAEARLFQGMVTWATDTNLLDPWLP